MICPKATPRKETLDLCKLNDKVCLLEMGDECEVYTEYLEEEGA